MARFHTAAQGQEASWSDIGSIATGLGRVKLEDSNDLGMLWDGFLRTDVLFL